VTLILVLMCPAVLGAQERAADSEGQGMPADIMAAHTFLLTAYPDLAGRPLQIQARRDGDGVVASVVDLAASRADGAAPPLVTARFEFDRDTRLRRFDGYGSLLHEADNLALQQELIANPRWIESDADVWLTGRGAASTFAAPSGALDGRSAAVAERIGAQLVAGTRFEWHTGHLSKEGGRVFRSRPAWVTEAVAAAPDGTALIYQFEYEPFGGRLIAVSLQEAR
jgi:hypothetical protein